MDLLVEIANTCVSGVAETFFIPVLLTGVQLDLVSYLLFTSIFGVVITLWVRLSKRFLKVRMEAMFFLKLGFTPCKAEQPLQGMELQEKEAQKIKAYRKSL